MSEPFETVTLVPNIGWDDRIRVLRCVVLRNMPIVPTAATKQQANMDYFDPGGQHCRAALTRRTAARRADSNVAAPGGFPVGEALRAMLADLESA